MIMNKITPAIDIQTTLFLVQNFFVPSFDSSEEDGPSACLPGVCQKDGAPGGIGARGGCGGTVDGDGGA